ncbi:transcription elongation factor NusA [Porphyromonadaceae bacterium COT-184 OH4590]|nr:transcription elongation factor NusA [Porphyromonadaceae bacterium COT-184 OH4590]MDO4725851.1 transcription termination factor NusA [Porphyromonadaceae bacterium]
MAKKEHSDIISSFAELKEFKNIDNSTMLSILEESFRKVISNIHGSDQNYDFIFNPDKGDFEIWRNRVVVEDDNLTDPHLEISLSEAKKIADDYEVGEEVQEQVDINSFGRRAVLNLSQILSAKIVDVQKDSLYTKYSQLLGQIISAEVYQVWKKEILLLDDDNNEILLPKTEQLPNDFFKKGEIIRAIVSRVDNNNNNPKIYVSRTQPLFLERLLEREVPEIQDGLITVKKIVRIPGEKAKIAVESYDDRIDPVGSCVGIRGNRIQPIIRELNKESIDVINYTSNPSLYIARALAPAKVTSIIIDNDNKRANVYINPEDISSAIGRNGANIKLAIQLTGYHIEIIRGDVEIDEEDIYLDDFADEIDEWVIEILKNIGCDTAKQVLRLTREELVERTDLEDETIDHVINVLKAEFDKE